MENTRQYPFDHQFQRFLEALFKDEKFEEKAAHAISMSILGIDDHVVSYLEPAALVQVEVVFR